LAFYLKLPYWVAFLILCNYSPDVTNRSHRFVVVTLCDPQIAAYLEAPLVLLEYFQAVNPYDDGFGGTG
jgi:hypothetical protein